MQTLFSSDTATAQLTHDESLPSYSKRVLQQLQDTFQQLFDSVADKTAKDFVSDVDESSKVSMAQLFTGLTGAVITKHWMNKKTSAERGTYNMLEAAVNENVDLIKSIPREYLGQVAKVANRAIASGGGAKELYAQVKQYSKITDRRAKFIANDQTRKIYTGLNAKRMTNAGMDQFKWLHSGGSLKPRPYHQNNLNGNVYSLSDPPIIDPKTGEKGLPGKLPHCKCSMIPVITGETEENES